MSGITSLADQYLEWLRDRTTISDVGKGWSEITAPFLDRHNDDIQLYVKPTNGGFVLTDDGYTLTDLAQSGCALNTPKRQALLTLTLNGFGVRLEGQTLTVKATAENFPLRKHNLIQAMLAVNDLFCLAGSTVKNLFLEDVTGWLDHGDIRYTRNIKLSGQSGYDHVFDFVIPKSRDAPERLLRAITAPSRDTAESFAFAWHDTRDTRPAGAIAYAIVNDDDKPVPAPVHEALTAYRITPAPWSRRDTFHKALAA